MGLGKKFGIAASSEKFVERLTMPERELYLSFTRFQEDPKNEVLCVFRGTYTGRLNYAALPETRASQMADRIREKINEDPDYYRTLLMVLNLKRSFQSQWGRKPGTLYSYETFLARRLICVPGLPDSPHNKLTLVHNAAEPAQTPKRRSFTLTGIPGGLNI